MSLQIEQITTESAFLNIKEEWGALLLKSQNNDITLTWEWMYTWWDVFKDHTKKLMILTVRDAEGQLVGIAPFHIRVVQVHRLLPAIRQIAFLDFGEDEADEICSEYLNFIICQGREAEAIPCIFDYLVRDLWNAWDEIFLDAILGTSETAIQFKTVAKRNAKVAYRETSRGFCDYVSLPERFDILMNGRSSHFRNQYQHSLKKITLQGKLVYAGVHDSSELEHGLEILETLHQKRWVKKGKPGVFSSDKFFAFHRKFSKIALSEGWLFLRYLLLDEKPVAVEYDFLYNGKIYGYQTGLDTEITKNVSMGMLMRGYCIHEGIAQGVREYDFLLGDTVQKRRWTKTCRELKTIRVFALTERMRTIRAYRKIWAALRLMKFWG